MKKNVLFLILYQISIFLIASELPDFNRIVAKQQRAAELKRTSYARWFDLMQEDNREMENYDVKYYHIDIEIDFAQQFVLASVLMQAEIAENNVDEIQLHFTDDLDVLNIQQNNQDLTFTHNDGLVDIQLLQTANSGDEIEIIISYEGFPQNRLNDGMKFQQHSGTPVVFTMVSPKGARKWWPCKDTPADKPDSLAITITYPSQYISASNGTLISQVNNGNGTITSHWFEAYPVATYLTSLAITNYQIFTFSWQYAGEQMVVDNYLYPELYDVSSALFALSEDMLTFYSDTYGLYPFISEKYGHATCTNLGALAMEHQTCTSFDASYITDPDAEYTVAHELSHQWAGNCLSIGSWAHVWLKEGFASYSEALWAEHLYGEDALHAYMLSEDGGSQLDECLYRDPDGTANHIFNWVIYAKGSWTLHMLRGVLGDDLFFQLLQDFMQDPDLMYDNILTDDLENAAETVSGEELDWFFDEWFYNYGRPRYKYVIYRSTEVDSMKVALYSAGSAGDPFSMFVPYTIGQNEDRFWAEDGFNYYDLAVQNITDSLSLDPDNWVLDYGYTKQVPVLEEIQPERDGSIVIVWEEFFDPAIDGFNIYRKQAGESYEQINAQPVSGNAYFDADVTAGTEYYYKIAAVYQEAGNYISDYSNEITIEPVNYTFDEGLLLVDATWDYPATSPFPGDAEMDAFYETVIPIDHTVWDINAAGYPPLPELAKYSSIIWFTDDIVNFPFHNELYSIKSYLMAGGNLMLSSWKLLYDVETDFQEEFLGFTDAETHVNADFCGAFGQSDFPDIAIDLDKVPLTLWEDNLMFVNKFQPSASAETIYTYDSSTDDPDWENMPCAQRFENGSIAYTFGFPLYFMEESEIAQIITKVLDDFGENVIAGQHEIPNSPLLITDLANYPNPFNPSTTISFSLTMECAENTKIIIYNLKGQKICTLKCIDYVDVASSQMMHSSVWDGRDENNKSVSTGIYFYKLLIDDREVASNKMLLLK